MDIQYCAPGTRKGNRFWVIRGRDYVNGFADKQSFEMSTGKQSKEEAERIAPSLIAGWREHLIAKLGRPASVVVDRSFRAAADLYLDSRPSDKPFTANYRAIVARLCREIGAKPVAEIARQDLLNVCNKLYARGKGSSWNKAVFTPTRAVLYHVAAGQNPWLKKEPIEELCAPVAEAAVKTKSYSAVQVAHIISVAWTDKVHALCVFLFRHGLRLSEALAIKWENIDLDTGLMVYDITKTDDPDAWVPLDPIFANTLWLMPLQNGERKGRVFWFWKDRESVKFAKAGIQARLDKALGPGNTFHFTWHHCRHTFGYAINKAPLKTRMAMMNHKDIRTTLRYDRSELEQKKEALKLLPTSFTVKK